jgi:hypothetical protein
MFRYRDIETIHEYLLLLSLTHPLRARYIPAIGRSYEGRSIAGISIGGSDNGPTVYLQGNIHAREWISPAVVM